MTKGKAEAPDTRALYRKYRSKSLDEVVGQTHITDILSRALQQGKIAHAYLFTGPRGVGKTSIARILAHEINGLPYNEDTVHPDIIEIDAASNRRIDDIRDLREKVTIAPASAKYKVYIIDEVHMLTGESFNAFLKTLEEPPEHVVFMLATTDAHKLPVTITSRTQRFGLRSITPDDASVHLRFIADNEKIAINDDALALVVQHGDGSFRDSISLLDQLSSLADTDEPITRELVEHVLGMATQTRVDTLLQAYESHDRAGIIEQLSRLEKEGIAATITAEQLMQATRARIAASPELVSLLDALIDVAKSPRPDIKLLTALLRSQGGAPAKHAAAAVSAPELEVLEKEATKPHPDEKKVRANTEAPLATTVEPLARLSEGTSAARATQDVGTLAVARREAVPEDMASEDGELEEGSTDTPEIIAAGTRRAEAVSEDFVDEKSELDKNNAEAVSEEPLTSSEAEKTPASTDFDWDTYVSRLKENHIALATILAKCKAESNGTTLTVYTGTAFWKKKLDDIKYQPILHDALHTLGMGDLAIDTVPTTMPPKDSQAAAVAAIMGGGEEVDL